MDGGRYFPITDFGAVPGGQQLNTRAIQSAIDRALSEGGGRVVIPEGVFRSGSIFLKPGVALHLAAGAVLLGSANVEDYPKRPTRIEGHFEPWRMALVNAEGIDGLRIGGPGKIDGNGIPFWAAFWQRRKENPQCTNLEVERPRLLFIDRCTGVRVEGLTLRDSGFWNVHLYRCRDVLVEGVSIYTPGPAAATICAPSTDGIDVDSCRNVTVRRCDISVDDDCIALKGSKGPEADRDADSPPVEDVLIEDCTFGYGQGVLTVGSEAATVRNVTVRNCTVTGNNNLVRLKLRPDTPQLYENIVFDTIRLSGKSGRVFDVRPWSQFFDLKGHAPPSRRVRNVAVRKLSGTYGTMGRIAGNPGDVIEDVTIEDVALEAADDRLETANVGRLVIERARVNGKPLLPSASEAARADGADTTA